MQPQGELDIGPGRDNAYCGAEIKANLKCLCSINIGVDVSSQRLRADGEGNAHAGNP